VAQQVQHCVIDDAGRVYLATAQGLGLVHSQDVLHAAQALEEQRWPDKKIPASELAGRYGFVKSPQQRASSIT
jgi:sRNA-binding protein